MSMGVWKHLILLILVFVLAAPPIVMASSYQRCAFPLVLSCVGQPTVDQAQVSFTLVNNEGDAINITGVGSPIKGTRDCTSAILVSVNGLNTTQVRVNHHDEAHLVVDCGIIGEKLFWTKLAVPYVNLYTGLEYVAAGNIYIRSLKRELYIPSESDVRAFLENPRLILGILCIVLVLFMLSRRKKMFKPKSDDSSANLLYFTRPRGSTPKEPKESKKPWRRQW